MIIIGIKNPYHAAQLCRMITSGIVFKIFGKGK